MSRLPNDIVSVQLCPATIVADRVRQNDRAQPPPARGAGIAHRLIPLSSPNAPARAHHEQGLAGSGGASFENSLAA